MSINRVGVIGFPVKHSLSPAMHNAAFKALNMDDAWLYDAMEIPPDIARYGVLEPKRHGYIGINITIPFKQQALEFCRPDDVARAVGAVNTIDFRTDTGTNTDVDGFIEDLQAHDVLLKDTRALILGAGGAARAAVYGLWREGAEIVVTNRTRSRADEMLTQLTMTGGVRGVRTLTLDEAAEWQPQLIINATPVGMSPNITDSPWIHGVPFPHGATVYDMIYTPSRTALMQQAEAHDGRAIGGLGMLVRQGAKSFALWTGIEPPLDVMFAAVRDALQQREANG